MNECQSEPLAAVADMLSGGTPSKANQAYWDGAIPWLTPKDMGQWSGLTEETVSPGAIGNGTRLAPESAIFIAVRGMSLHNEIRVIYPRMQLTFNQDIKAIIPKDCIGSLYLYYVLLFKKTELLGAVESAGHGTGRLPTDKLKSLSIPRFGEYVETELGEFFTAMDDKIDLNYRTNQTLDVMVRTIFKDWFVDFGPTRAKMESREPYLAPELWNLFPDALDDEEKPVGWKIRPLEECIERLKLGRLYDQKTVLHNGDVPVLDQGKSGIIGFHNNEPNIYASAEKRVSVFANHTCNQRLIDFNFSTIQNVIPFIGRGLPTEWVHFASMGKQRFEEYRGHWPTFVAHEIIVPTAEVAVVFRHLVDELLSEISANEAEAHTLARTRDLLLPQLMSGEIRLRDADRVVEAVA